MPTNALRFLLLLAACAVSVQASAGVGATSAGVIPSVGGTSTDPTSNVQSQSSGFVQQNQQAQSATTPNGSTLLAGIAAGAAPGQAAANNVSGNAAQAADAKAAASATDTPAVPPPPPPTYVSVMKHVNPSASDSAAPASPPLRVEAAPAAPSGVKPPPSAAPLKLAAAPERRGTHPPVTPIVKPVAQVDAEPPAVTGGRGAAPDGVTFYSGLAIAGTLMALAFSLFLRTGKNDGTPRDL